MKSIKKIMLLTMMCMVVFCLAGCGGTAMIVNGEKVPQAVADYYIQAGSASLSTYGIDTSTDDGKQYMAMIEQQAVDNCTQLAVVRAAAKERELSVTQEEIDKEFEVEKEAFADEESYKAFLDENNLSEDTIKWIIESQLYYKVLFDELNKDVTCTDEQLQNAYNANPKAFDTVEVSYILVQPENQGQDGKFPEEEWTKAKTEADAALQKLQSGTDFAEVAKEYSDDESTKDNGGKLPNEFTAESQDLDATFVQAAFAIPQEGAYTTQAVRSENFGYFIIKLDKKTTGWENLKEAVENSLVGDQKDENFANFMDETMANLKYDKEYKYKYAEKDDKKADDADNADDSDKDSQQDDSGDNTGDQGGDDQKADKDNDADGAADKSDENDVQTKE